jgi:hypothetical protein
MRRVSMYGKRGGASTAKAEAHYKARQAWADVSDDSQSSQAAENAEIIDNNSRVEGLQRPKDAKPSGTDGPFEFEEDSRPRRAGSRARVSDSSIVAEKVSSTGRQKEPATRQRNSFPPVRGRKTALEVETGFEQVVPPGDAGFGNFELNPSDNGEETEEVVETVLQLPAPQQKTVEEPERIAPADPFEFRSSSSTNRVSPPAKSHKRRSGDLKKEKEEIEIDASSPSTEQPPAKFRELQFYKPHALPTAVKVGRQTIGPARIATAARGGGTATRGNAASRGAKKSSTASAANKASTTRAQLQFAAAGSSTTGKASAKPNPATRLKMNVEPIDSLPCDKRSTPPTTATSFDSAKENIPPGFCRGLLPAEFDPLELSSDSSSYLEPSDKENYDPTAYVIRGSNAHLYSDPSSGKSSPVKILVDTQDKDWPDDDEEGDLESPSVFVSPPRGLWKKLTPGPGPGQAKSR